jgi:ATP synthase protein I
MAAKILVSELDEQFDLKGLHLRARRAALSIVAVQFGVTLFISAVGFLMGGPRTAISAFMGGGIGTLTSLCMVVNLFRLGADAEPEKILKGVYRGEFLKLALTVVLFGLVLKGIEVSFGPMLGCFSATLLVYWVALLRSPI